MNIVQLHEMFALTNEVHPEVYNLIRWKTRLEMEPK